MRSEIASYLPEETLIEKAIDALLKALGPV